jgi:hypothetical protein
MQRWLTLGLMATILSACATAPLGGYGERNFRHEGYWDMRAPATGATAPLIPEQRA